MTLTELFTNIANAIRTKTGSTEPIIAEDFPSAIEAIPTSGSGTSIETCEVSITFYSNAMSGSQPSYVTYTTVKDEKIVSALVTNDDADWSGTPSSGGFS